MIYILYWGYLLWKAVINHVNKQKNVGIKNINRMTYIAIFMNILITYFVDLLFRLYCGFGTRRMRCNLQAAPRFVFYFKKKWNVNVTLIFIWHSLKVKFLRQQVFIKSVSPALYIQFIHDINILSLLLYLLFLIC